MREPRSDVRSADVHAVLRNPLIRDKTNLSRKLYKEARGSCSSTCIRGRGANLFLSRQASRHAPPLAHACLAGPRRLRHGPPLGDAPRTQTEAAATDFSTKTCLSSSSSSSSSS